MATSHAANKIDQKEYLKRYLSGDKIKKKKKKDKKHKSSSHAIKVKIIDDDLGESGTGAEIDEELLLTGDDAPQIVGEYVEEGPSASNKWRSIVVKDEPVAVKSEPLEDDDGDLWGSKMCKKASKKIEEYSPMRTTIKVEQRQHTPDISPPRRRTNDQPNLSPVSRRDKTRSSSGQRYRHSSDRSPRRKQEKSSRSSRKRNSSAEQSPRHKRKKSTKSGRRCNSRSPVNSNKNQDQIPVRRRRKDASDLSPARAHKSDSSPVRHRHKSPTRRKRSNSSDQSPPRRRDSDLSPPRNRAKNTTRRSSRDSIDLSPPRRQHSPARRNRKSPPRRRRDSSSDQSPHRRRDSDQSPARKRCSSPTNRRRKSPTRENRGKRGRRSSSPDRIKKEPMSPDSRSRRLKPELVSSPSPPPTHKPKTTKTLDGKKAGLQNAQALKMETEERRRQEDLNFSKLPSVATGQDAEVQVRSTGRRGKRARDAAAEDPEEQRRKAEQEAQKRELYDRWGKGLKQVEDHRLRIAELEHESSKPLARYSNDEDLERHLREQERADDPMLEYMRQKKKKQEKEQNLPVMPTYEGSYPENRFGIRPGYRWDGVDRSNGYETKWLNVQSEKVAVREEAYKYSVEDL